ncbi:acyltransferase [Plebeiibacterium marinum]|uniref:Acyltransferase n=1 Tax=Plebeiibacterium marinum TaxID=2992111 RepID=A0AAE3MAN7_9BACT|nr:acyltransferase [Plebeiobacterium marinum]MCW3804154.1 acyltransferase [Plebeiobacterium marinum]
MIISNISLGERVDVDPSSNINYAKIGNGVKIAKRCSVFGGPDCQLEIGDESYFGINTVVIGYWEKIIIGGNVSIAQNVNIMSASGPNASAKMQRVFPIMKGKVEIGNHCWIGANSIIMPDVVLGEYCVVAANSFVNSSFPPYSVIGGNPAKLIRIFTNEEIAKLDEDC